MIQDDEQKKEMEEVAKVLGSAICRSLPPGVGFTLLLFDANDVRGLTSYLSSAKREDMIKAVKEFLIKLGGDEV